MDGFTKCQVSHLMTSLHLLNQGSIQTHELTLSLHQLHLEAENFAILSNGSDTLICTDRGLGVTCTKPATDSFILAVGWTLKRF